MPFYKKQLRRPANDYIVAAHISLRCVPKIEPTFSRTLSLAAGWQETLIASAAHANFTLHAYCVMPDHVHFVSEALADTCDLIPLSMDSNNKLPMNSARGELPASGKGRYYDHVLRPNETIENVACYIWWNPVRKTLCPILVNIHWSGSQTLDWMKHSSTAPQWHPPWKPER